MNVRPPSTAKDTPTAKMVSVLSSKVLASTGVISSEDSAADHSHTRSVLVSPVSQSMAKVPMNVPMRFRVSHTPNARMISALLSREREPMSAILPSDAVQKPTSSARTINVSQWMAVVPMSVRTIRIALLLRHHLQ